MRGETLYVNDAPFFQLYLRFSAGTASTASPTTRTTFNSILDSLASGIRGTWSLLYSFNSILDSHGSMPEIYVRLALFQLYLRFSQESLLSVAFREHGFQLYLRFSILTSRRTISVNNFFQLYLRFSLFLAFVITVVSAFQLYLRFSSTSTRGVTGRTTRLSTLS